MKQYKVDYEMIVGKGMFHCYPVFPICKEGKDGWNMMVRLIKKTYEMTVKEQTRSGCRRRKGYQLFYCSSLDRERIEVYFYMR